MINDYKSWFNQANLDYAAVDQQAISATSAAYQRIKCLDCGACCRGTVTTFTEDDIPKAAKALGVNSKAFKKLYLFMDLDGKYTTITTPCPMLNLDDNTCKIYDARPKSCASFPYTQLPHFIRRKQVHLANATFCPITEYVLEALMTQ